MMPDNRATSLLASCIFELIPMKSALAKAADLPDGATVSVTASPDKGMAATVDLSIELAARGLSVIPHLSARGTKTTAEFETIVHRLTAAGIDQVFVVGGDASDPGDFFDALDLLEALSDMGRPFGRIGVAGYPEGHPSIADGQLMEALVDKLPHASYIATQLCFDEKAIERWIGLVRTAGIDLPIFLGLPGAVDPIKLMRIGARIGVGPSLRYLRKNRRALTSVVKGSTSAANHLVSALAPSATQLGIEGLHIFTFNAVAETVAWHRTAISAIDSGGPGEHWSG